VKERDFDIHQFAFGKSRRLEEYELAVIRPTMLHAEPAQMVAVAHDSDFLRACFAHSLSRALSSHKLIFSRLS
jgi:hypothetical protein